MATNSSSNEDVMWCRYMATEVIVIAWLILYLFITPLFLYVLYVGYRQTKMQQVPASHSNVFTFHIVAMEILTMIGSFIYIAESAARLRTNVGGNIFSTGINGQMCFHCLTCVERYLAVAHPITYLRLKKRGGVMVRNIAIVATWVVNVGLKCWQTINQNTDLSIVIPELSLALFCFVVVTFCTISVLCVLIYSGPGERGGNSRRIDQSKQRAFVTLMVITGMLFFRFVLFFVSYVLATASVLEMYESCVFLFTVSFFNFPSSLVLPLMFLQKYGKLPKWSIVNCKLQLKFK